jgi:tRNA (guanine37-N1)-methyltransferase
MVMRPDVVDAALAAAADRWQQTEGSPAAPVIYLSPRGRLLTQDLARELAAGPGMTLLCGRYEGVDQRVLEAHEVLEVSLGDYILSGGEPAALALMDAVVRLLPGVMGNEVSSGEESFGAEGFEGLLEYPLYTRPAEWQSRPVPEVLSSGHHEKIRQWRRAQAEEITRTRRPDLWARYLKQKAEGRKR